MSYVIERVDPGERKETILRIWEDSLPAASGWKLDWMYGHNPAGKPLCWIAGESGSGRPVGFTALLPRRMHVDGRSVLAGIAADFAVVRGHRGFGPALALQNAVLSAARQGEVELVYGTPNADSAPVFRRVGYSKVHTLTAMTCVLRSRAGLERRLAGPLPALVAPVADGSIRLVSRMRQLTRLRNRFRGVHLDSIDDRFDALWDRLADRSRGLLGRRDAEFLRWRFRDSPHQGYRLFGLTGPVADRLVGYMVYQRQADRVIIDDLACEGTGQSLDNLLLRFVRSQRGPGGPSTIAVSFVGPAALVQGLRRSGFAVREAGPHPLMSFAPEGSPLAGLVDEPGNWWFFSADNDV